MMKRVFLTLCFAPASVLAQEAHDHSHSVLVENLPQEKLSDSSSAASAGQTVYVDPETGKLTSTPDAEVSAAVGNMQSQMIGQVGASEIRRSADGTMTADLNEQFQMYLNATVDEKGELTIKHSQTPLDTRKTD